MNDIKSDLTLLSQYRCRASELQCLALMFFLQLQKKLLRVGQLILNMFLVIIYV